MFAFANCIWVNHDCQQCKNHISCWYALFGVLLVVPNICQGERIVAKRKIAITIPPDTLERIDTWAEKMQQSRSQFMLDQIESSLQNLEDEEVTRRYDKMYADSEAIEENRALADDMQRLAPQQDSEKW